MEKKLKMMISLKKEICDIEVYNTLNLEHFFAAKNILADHHIPYKDTSTDNQLRISFNHMRNDHYVLSRDGTVKNNYSLSVRKSDEYKARTLLNHMK